MSDRDLKETGPLVVHAPGNVRSPCWTPLAAKWPRPRRIARTYRCRGSGWRAAHHGSLRPAAVGGDRQLGRHYRGRRPVNRRTERINPKQFLPPEIRAGTAEAAAKVR